MNQQSTNNHPLHSSPVTKVLLFLNIGLFAADSLLNYGLRDIGAMYTLHTGYFKFYQLVTHMFFHGDLGHLFMNMFALFMFGQALESTLGSKKFAALYFLSGLGAAGLQLLVYYLQGASSGMIGASGAVFGILAAFAVCFPNVKLALLFVPVPIKAKYFVPMYGAIELFFGVANFEIDNIAHFAHLGGAIVGLVTVLIWKPVKTKT